MPGPKILLVDDEARFRTTLAKRLKARGLDIATAASGEDAVEEVKQTHFDVVVLDIRMPGMDGLETLTVLKKIRPDLEIILLTGHASLALSQEGIRLGAYECLLKPCDLDVLMEKISQAHQLKK